MIQENTKKRIILLVDQTGMRHASVGYKYTISCVENVLESGDRSFRIRDIYENVGRQYNVKWTTVERAIRIAITQSDGKGKKKTNKEIVSQIVDAIYGGEL